MAIHLLFEHAVKNSVQQDRNLFTKKKEKRKKKTKKKKKKKKKKHKKTPHLKKNIYINKNKKFVYPFLMEFRYCIQRSKDNFICVVFFSGFSMRLLNSKYR